MVGGLMRLAVSKGSGSAPKLNWNTMRCLRASRRLRALHYVGGVDVALGGPAAAPSQAPGFAFADRRKSMSVEMCWAVPRMLVGMAST